MNDIAQWLDDLLIADFHEAGIYLPGEKEAIERESICNRGMMNSGFEAQLLLQQSAFQNEVALQQLGYNCGFQPRQHGVFVSVMGAIGGILSGIGHVTDKMIHGLLPR